MTEQEQDVSRRDLPTLLAPLPSGVGVAALAGCADGAQPGRAPTPEKLAQTVAALSGTSNIFWVDSIAGTSQPNLQQIPLPPGPPPPAYALAVALGYLTAGDGGGGIF